MTVPIGLKCSESAPWQLFTCVPSCGNKMLTKQERSMQPSLTRWQRRTAQIHKLVNTHTQTQILPQSMFPRGTGNQIEFNFFGKISKQSGRPYLCRNVVECPVSSGKLLSQSASQVSTPELQVHSCRADAEGHFMRHCWHEITSTQIPTDDTMNVLVCGKPQGSLITKSYRRFMDLLL